MSSSTRYTFLLPAYKAAYFEVMLRSLQCQTYQDFKVLISDDCSPEPLHDIFNAVCTDDPRFIYRRNSENLGGKSLVAHWNLLVDLCDTDYCIMASDDDIYAPDFLLQMDHLTHKYPDLDIYRARCQQINGQGEILASDYNLDEYMTYLQYLTTFDFKMQICVPNWVFKTKSLKAIGGFVDFPTAMKSDSATCMLLARHGIACSKDILFSFRLSEHNISNNHNINFVREKEILRANTMFMEWYRKNIIPTIPTETSYDNNLAFLIRKAHESHMQEALTLYIRSLNLRELIQFLHICNKHGYVRGCLNTLQFILKWKKVRKDALRHSA